MNRMTEQVSLKDSYTFRPTINGSNKCIYFNGALTELIEPERIHDHCCPCKHKKGASWGG